MQIRNNILIGFTLLAATFGISNVTKAAPVPTKIAAITISSPTNNSLVSSPLTVSGKAVPGHQVKVSVVAVYDGGRKNIINTNARTARNGAWKTRPIALQLPQNAKNGRFEITALQTNGRIQKGRSIQKSRTVTVKLGQMVQVKPDIMVLNLDPVITSPTKNSSVSSPLTVRGTARKTTTRRPVHGTPTISNLVKVNIKATFTGGEMLLKEYTSFTDSDGKWHTPATEMWLPYGAKKAHFEITASQNTHTAKVIVNPSSSISYVLAKPTITSPSREARIALPKNVRIQGTGIPGHKIEVKVSGHWGSIYGQGWRRAGHGTAVVGATGKWSIGIAVEQVVPAGDVYRENYYKISAKQVFPDNKFSAAVTTTFNSTGN